MGFRDLVFSDLLGYRPNARPTWFGVISRLPFTPALVASVILRAQQVFHRSGRRRAASLMQTLGIALVGAEFVPGVHVGRGLRIVHPVGVVLGAGVRIGDDVVLASGVVGGAKYFEVHEGDVQAYPTLEDEVFVGAHAVLIGGVTIGRRAAVGANSVVLDDVPAGAVVAGSPARRVGTRRSA